MSGIILVSAQVDMLSTIGIDRWQIANSAAKVTPTIPRGPTSRHLLRGASAEGNVASAIELRLVILVILEALVILVILSRVKALSLP